MNCGLYNLLCFCVTVLDVEALYNKIQECEVPIFIDIIHCNICIVRAQKINLLFILIITVVLIY